MRLDVIARDVRGGEIGRWTFRTRWGARRFIAKQHPPTNWSRFGPMWTYEIEEPG